MDTQASTLTFLWPACMASPIRQYWLEADGVRTRCIRVGEEKGPPVVMLHGVTGHAEAFLRNVGSLGADHDVMALDFPGHGLSSFEDRSYEVEGYLKHLDAVLSASFGTTPVILVGLSLGGWVAIEFAARQPERIRALVLAAPGGATYNREVMTNIRVLTANAVEACTRASVRRRLEWLMADPTAVTEDLVEARYFIYSQAHMKEAVMQILCLQDPEIRKRNLIARETWPAVRCPALVIWGDSDGTGPLAVGESIADRLPLGQFVAFDQCGHWPQFERAKQFNAQCRDFIESL